MNVIPQIMCQGWMVCLWLWISFMVDVHGQSTLQIQADSSCRYTIQLKDGAGQIDGSAPPYLLEWSGGTRNNNSYAYWQVDFEQSPNTIQFLQVTDGNGRVYRGNFSLTCGVPAFSATARTTVLNQPTNCFTCNGSVSVSLDSLAVGTSTFQWSDGVTTTGQTSVRNGLCSGIYTVVITDSNGQLISHVVDLNCSVSVPTITCDTIMLVTVSGSALFNGVDVYPEDAVLATSITGAEYYWILPSGTVEPSIGFDCKDVGYHALTVVVQDSQTAEQITCPVLVEVIDSSGGTCSNRVASPYIVQSTSADASSCSICDGAYQFTRVVDSVTGVSWQPPLRFLWNDGQTGPTRNDLCPFQNYTLTIWDSLGTTVTEKIIVDCPLGACLDSTLINPRLICTQTYDPVCGCDGQTYLNSCVATHQFGVVSWSRGVCSRTSPFQVVVQTTPDAPCTTGGCSGSIMLTVTGGVGAIDYIWADSAGSVSNRTNLCNGVYQVTISDATGAHTVQMITVGQSGCVWPGDIDDNGVANHYDVLELGLAQGQTGPVRSNASTNWRPQVSTDWNGNILGSTTNLKYADADGNGWVDTIDVAAIQQNYGRYYARNGNGSPTGGSPLYIGHESGLPGDTVAVPIYWGDANSGVVSAYGVAFSLHYDNRYIDSNALWVSFNNSWLGTNLIQVQKDFRGSGILEVGVSRTDNLPATGIGQIGTIYFTIKEDLIMGRIQSDSVVSPLGLSGVRAINHLGQLIPVNFNSGTVRIEQWINVPPTPQLPLKQVFIYPNPVQGRLIIQSKVATLEYLRLYAANGQLIIEQALPGSLQTELFTHDLPSGMYILELQTNQGLWQQKVQVQH